MQTGSQNPRDVETIRMKGRRRRDRGSTILVCCVLGLLASGCARIAGHYTRPFFEDLTKSFLEQRDPELAEQGVPAFLLALDGLIRHSPENRNFLLAGAQAYSAYASAFVSDRNPERNRILAEKAKTYALRALSLQNRKFAQVRESPYGEFETCLPSFRRKDVPFLFQAAASWAGWIQANASSTDALADLPKVESLIRKVLELDETYSYGAAHAFLGALLTVRPPALGGRPEEARSHFERALELGQGKFLPSYVLYAKQYALLVYDKDLFSRLLETVLRSPADSVPELTLMNLLAQRQAEALAARAREEAYFD